MRQCAERLKEPRPPEHERQLNTLQSLPQSVFGSGIQSLRGAPRRRSRGGPRPQRHHRLGRPSCCWENRGVEPDPEIDPRRCPAAAVIAHLDERLDARGDALRVEGDPPSSPVADRRRRLVRAAEPEARKRFLAWMVDVGLAVVNRDDRGHERHPADAAPRPPWRAAPRRLRRAGHAGRRSRDAMIDLHERITREPRADQSASTRWTTW
nr:hypothetical protein [Deltaproteobacteria bacterium]